MQSKHHMFTYNNYKDPEEPSEWPDVEYIVWQEEVAPDTGTPHLQGYVFFCKKKRLSELKSINSLVHWEVKRGSAEQARAYCMKAESRKPGTLPREIGEVPVSQKVLLYLPSLHLMQ